MPIDTGYLYDHFIATVNTFQGGWYPPASVFIKVVNDISNELWDAKTEEAENNEKVNDDLYVFLRTKNCIVTSSNLHYGTFTLPDDYGQFSAATIAVYQGKTYGYDDLECVTCNSKKQEDEEEKYQRVQRYLDGIVEHNVKKINNSKWASCLSSKTKPPTLESPKITQTDSGYQVSPRSVSVVIFKYYVQPTDATYLYTTIAGDPQTGAGDLIVYNTNSKPLEWNMNLINEFIARLLEKFGIFTANQFLTQVGNQKIKEIK